MNFELEVGEQTTVSKASQHATLRTVIPMSVVKQWKLEVGDKLDWEFTIVDGKFALLVRKTEK